MFAEDEQEDERKSALKRVVAALAARALDGLQPWEQTRFASGWLAEAKMKCKVERNLGAAGLLLAAAQEAERAAVIVLEFALKVNREGDWEADDWETPPHRDNGRLPRSCMA